MQTFDPRTFDPYRALGLPRGATAAQIKKAHRALAKRYHPDTPQGDTILFLSVQEAYRVLSDPLLRRDWDARHAPGPVRATAPGEVKAKARRHAASRPKQSEGAAPPEPEETPPPGPGRPRSKRAYTWSASEVPWWEEGVARDGRQGATRAKRAKASPKPATEPIAASSAPTAPDFEVYNRSSGAAWSMAARAYFRKGDEDLPRRGSFRHVGTQVVTAGRARMAAEAEARLRPNPPAAAPQASAPSGVLGRLRRKLGGNGK